MRRIILVFIAGFATWNPHLVAQATTYILDDFESSTTGQPPLSPQVGSSSYLAGSHLVVDHASTKWLESGDTSGTGGFVAQWFPAEDATDFRLDLGLRIPAMSLDGQIRHGVLLTTPSSLATVGLDWSGNQTLATGGDVPTVLLPDWTVNDSYDLAIEVSCSADTFAVILDGVVEHFGPLGFDCVKLDRLSISSSVPGTQTQQFDTVHVYEIVPPIFVDGFESGDTSAWDGPPPPASDQCATAPSVNDATASYVDTLASNSASGVVDSCGGGATSVDGWFEYQPSCTGEVVFTTCHPDTEFDTVVSAWQGCPATTELNCNDDDVSAPPACDLNGANRKSTTYFNVIAGETIYLRIRSFQDTPTPGSLVHFSLTCNPF